MDVDHQNDDVYNFYFTRRKYLYNYSVECLVDRVLSPCRRYTRFGIGPFESGHATTVANNLRRGLLDGVPGWSLTGVRFKDARHEFFSLYGVRESVIEMIINIRECVLTGPPPLRDEQKFIGNLRIVGPKKVTLSDITFPKGIEPINPDQYIASVADGGVLDLTIKFEYINHNKKSFIPTISPEEQSTFLALNPTSFPVKRVSYSVCIEPHPVNQTEIEYIFLEILTDNSIHPQRALIISTQHIIDLIWPIGGRRLRPGSI